MKRIAILVLGILILATETQSPQREETSIVVVNAPSKEPRNPYQEEYEKLLYPVVRITAGFSTGSGVVINHPTGINSDTEVTEILTAAHVVGDESTVKVEFFYQAITTIECSVVLTDTSRDLALLRALRASVARAQLAPEDFRPYVFSPVYTVGCSLGLTPRPSEGIISVVDKDHWEVTSPILPGNSGGPVFDKRTYQVIGIAVWVKIYNGQLITTMAGIVPIQEVYRFLDDYEKLSKPGDADR